MPTKGDTNAFSQLLGAQEVGKIVSANRNEALGIETEFDRECEKIRTYLEKKRGIERKPELASSPMPKPLRPATGNMIRVETATTSPGPLLAVGDKACKNQPDLCCSFGWCKKR